MRKRIISSVLLLLLIIPSLWLINLVIIFPYIPIQLLRYQSLQKADAIVVPSGEFCRIDYGVELLKRGLANWIYSPGDAPYNIHYFQQAVKKLKNRGAIFQYATFSASTLQDALNTRDFVTREHIHSILLTTSPYHSKRAYWIFRHVLPKNVSIISATVPLEQSYYSLDEAKMPNTWAYGVTHMEQKKFFGYYILYSWRKF